MKNNDVKLTMKSTVNLPMTESGRLRECRECAFSNSECTYCTELARHIYSYQYACPKFRTDEEELARKKAQARDAAAKTERKLNFLLTSMCNCASATQMLLEDFDSRFEDQNVERQWRQSRKMAYNQIRENIEKCRRLFNQYIQPDFDNLFTEKGRKEYDVAMYDNHQRDAQEWCRLQLLYLDRCWDNEENADKVTAFLEGLPSNNIFDKGDIEHYRMKQ